MSQVLLDVTAVEFVTFMRILTCLPSMNTLVGRQQLVDIVAEQADLNSAFNVCLLTMFICRLCMLCYGRQRLGHFILTSNLFLSYFVNVDERPVIGSQPNLASRLEVVSIYKCTKIFWGHSPKFGAQKTSNF